jgi:hypothetical protein
VLAQQELRHGRRYAGHCRTAAEDRLGCGSGFCSCFGFHLEIGRGAWGGSSEFVRLTFLDRNRTGRAGWQAGTEAIAVGFLDQRALPLIRRGHPRGTDDALTAAIALFFIDNNDIRFM